MLAKLAARVAPPSVKQHLADAGGRARAARAGLAGRASGEARTSSAPSSPQAKPIRCECCLRTIESADDAAEKDGSLVHAGDCEQQWGSAYDEPTPTTRRGGADEAA